MSATKELKHYLFIDVLIIIEFGSPGGAGVAQLVRCGTLMNLSSGLDLRVLSSSPVLGSTLGVEPIKKKKKQTKKKKRGSTGDTATSYHFGGDISRERQIGV